MEKPSPQGEGFFDMLLTQLDMAMARYVLCTRYVC